MFLSKGAKWQGRAKQSKHREAAFPQSRHTAPQSGVSAECANLHSTGEGSSCCGRELVFLAT